MSSAEGESWVLIYQRAYLQRFHGINPLDGNDVAAFGGETGGSAIEVLIADSVEQDQIRPLIGSHVAPSWLAEKARTELVCAGGRDIATWLTVSLAMAAGGGM